MHTAYRSVEYPIQYDGKCIQSVQKTDLHDMYVYCTMSST